MEWRFERIYVVLLASSFSLSLSLSLSRSFSFRYIHPSDSTPQDKVREQHTWLLCCTDSGTSGLIKSEISCFVGGIFNPRFLFLIRVSFLVIGRVVLRIECFFVFFGAP